MKILVGLIAGLIIGATGGASADETDALNADVPASTTTGQVRGWVVGVTGSIERGQTVLWDNGTRTHPASPRTCRTHLCREVRYARAEGFDRVRFALAAERLRCRPEVEAAAVTTEFDPNGRGLARAVMPVRLHCRDGFTGPVLDTLYSAWR
jgi:hypothetical protein